MLCSDETVSVKQMQRELEALRQASISVFSVAVSNRVDEVDVQRTSSIPQLANVNYFLSPRITDLNSLSGPLAAQVLFRHALTLVNSVGIKYRKVTTV